MKMYYKDRYGYITLALPILKEGSTLDSYLVEYQGKGWRAENILYYVINNLSRDTKHPEDFAYGDFFVGDEDLDVEKHNREVAEYYS